MARRICLLAFSGLSHSTFLFDFALLPLLRAQIFVLAHGFCSQPWLGAGVAGSRDGPSGTGQPWLEVRLSGDRGRRRTRCNQEQLGVGVARDGAGTDGSGSCDVDLVQHFFTC
jgi:hypothetical protein